MYVLKNKIYADAGRVLIGKNKIGYSFSGEVSEFTEHLITLDDVLIEGNYLKYFNNKIIEKYIPDLNYAQLKAFFVKKRYSNDDQIALMLNKDYSDEDSLAYIKMQEYRDWCGTLAKKVLELNENKSIA